jgi:SNF2 family DNA or RNA helicase
MLPALVEIKSSFTRSLPLEGPATSAVEARECFEPTVAKVDSSLPYEVPDSITSTADMLSLGNKFIAFLSLLALSVSNGEKMILFSQSLPTLNLIEHFLGTPDWGEALLSTEGATFPDMKEFSNWKLRQQYLRIDGSTTNRQPIRHQNRYRRRNYSRYPKKIRSAH